MEYRLEELFDLQMGKTPSRSVTEYWESGNNKWISIADLSKCGKYIYDTKECLSDIAVPESGIKQIPANTVVMSFKLSIGKTAITSEPMYSNEAIMSFRDRKLVQLLPEYIYYLLLSKNWDDGTNKAVMGKTLNKATLSKVKVNIHSMQEQQEIVYVLNQATALIELHQQQLQKLDELVKARFVEMFGMPVSNTKHWKTEKMNRVAPAVNYSGVFDDTVWLLNLDMVESQTGRILDYLIVSKSEIGNSTCAFDTSNVLYSKLRPYLNKVVIPDRCGFATSELVPLQPVKEKINREYLAFMLRSDEFVNTISEKVAGAKMPRVSMSDFRSFDVPIPPYELQMQFTDFVHQVDKSKLLQFFCFPI